MYFYNKILKNKANKNVCAIRLKYFENVNILKIEISIIILYTYKYYLMNIWYIINFKIFFKRLKFF